MQAESLLYTVKQYLQRYRLIERGEKILVSVSGGLDSMVLLNILTDLRGAMQLEIAVAHLNHELRGAESVTDEKFVRAAAADYGVECYVERANTKAIAETNKQSIQEAARELRYEFLGMLRKSIGFQKIATAHHANDNAETMLFNFLRGAGVQGLSGIPMLRRDVEAVRPLLGVTREEIRAYAIEQGISFREDSSNAKTEYARNFLRHSIIPELLEHINPNLISTLFRTSEIFDQLEQYLDGEARALAPQLLTEKSPDEIDLDINLLRTKAVFLQEYVVRHAAREITGHDIDFGMAKTLLNLTDSETGASCSLTGDYLVYRNRAKLIFTKRQPIRPFRYPIELNKEYEFDHFRFATKEVPEPRFARDDYVEYVDAAAIGRDLMLRTWHTGDSFVPLGMTEQKKLSDFFVDEKIPLMEKQAIPILISGGHIVWVCGKRLDDRFKITPETEHIIKLEYQPRNRDTE